MTKGLSLRLALGNLRKNYRFFIPRVLAETGLLACFYIMFTLACDGRLASVKGGDYLPTFMWMGAVIIGLLSGILMFYTNSFLMKQRKREFGLYSVLGLERKHICRILFHESLCCSLLSVVLGLSVGILFYKIASLTICKLLKAQVIAGFYFISPRTILPAGAIFLGIDALAYLINCLAVCRLKPVELLASANTGEKEPKVKWVLLLLGVLSLGGGYWISLTTENPLKAILVFFAAVLLVIAGTYCLFVAGSIFVLKSLKKRDRVYYRPGSITAISGLLYRMKQNAVGLASVAILATGVLVMISTTFCLYSRTENTLKTQYPYDFYLSTLFYDDNGQPVLIPEEETAKMVAACAEKNGLKIRETCSQTFFDAAFSHRENELIADRAFITTESDLSSLCDITFITEETYVRLGGQPLNLKEREAAVCALNIADDFGDADFRLGGTTYHVAQKLTLFPISAPMMTVSYYGFVVADDETFDAIFAFQQASYGPNASELQRRFCVKFENKEAMLDRGAAFARDVRSADQAYIESLGYTSYSTRGFDSVWDARESLYGMYGTLLFLGVLLGLVCLFATVLIIYYKQISEGYEDRSRYQIMRKIGLTDREVKKTIRTQIMLVFFLPLLTAGVHVAFAFPILTKLMEVLLLDNPWLFARWCLIVYLAFAVVYALIYKMTAKTYYKIVN